MREIFKKYLKIKPVQIELDKSIVDTNDIRNSPDFEPSYSITSSHLASVFNHFHNASEADILHDVTVFSHKLLPGRLFS